MTHLGSQAEKVRDVLAIRNGEKWKKTLIGLLWLALAIIFEIYDLFPQNVRNLMLLFAGYCGAGDLVRGFFGFLPAATRDMRSALKGTNGKSNGDGTSIEG